MTDEPIVFSTSNANAITFSTHQPASFTFNGADGKALITIKPDGTIVKGPAFTTNDEASLEFWRVLERCFPQHFKERST